jgi:penicillin-binding protein 2
MLQMAQAEAAMATGGHRHTPHLVKAIENAETRQPKRLVGDELPPLPWKPEHVAFIHKALYGVTQEGTSARSFVGAPYKTGGKTGTAQVVGIKENEKYNASKMDERLRDHALYTAFAPLEEPRLALAMVVENAGFGAGAAAPIARRVFDYLLQGLYPSEEDIAATREAKSTAPIGTQRPIADVPLPGFAVDSAASVAGAASGVASAGGAATGAAAAASDVLPVGLPASGAPATVPVPVPLPAPGKAVASAR